VASDGRVQFYQVEASCYAAAWSLAQFGLAMHFSSRHFRNVDLLRFQSWASRLASQN
jgi:hypothetical protein